MARSQRTMTRRGGGLALVLAFSALLLLGSVAGCGAADDANAKPASVIQLVGQPTAKITTGTNVEVTGQLRNTDKNQHDVFLQATLTDAGGKTIGTATGKAEDVHAGQTVTYTLQGTATQPTWSGVTVTITKVTENVNGTGSD